MSNELIPIWVGRYLKIKYREKGLDREGVDDWGIVRMILLEQHGYAVWAFSGYPLSEMLKALLDNFPRVTDGERLFDITYLRRQRVFGLILSPGKMITSLPMRGVGVFEYDTSDDRVTVRTRP